MDMMGSYGVARKEVLLSVEHRRYQGLNNRAENSYQLTRERGRRMKWFKAIGQVQRFLAVYGLINNHFRPRRHRLQATEYRRTMRERFDTWNSDDSPDAQSSATLIFALQVTSQAPIKHNSPQEPDSVRNNPDQTPLRQPVYQNQTSLVVKIDLS